MAIQLAAEFEFVRDNEAELFTAAHELASALSRITIIDLKAAGFNQSILMVFFSIRFFSRCCRCDSVLDRASHQCRGDHSACCGLEEPAIRESAVNRSSVPIMEL